MTSPLSRIRTGSFFNGVIFEYSSLGWPGATAAGTNSILSIRPVSIAAMRTLRANGEAGEKVSFMSFFPWEMLDHAVARRCLQQTRSACARERGDEAIQLPYAVRWIASPRLSSGGHSPDPLARNDGGARERHAWL